MFPEQLDVKFLRVVIRNVVPIYLREKMEFARRTSSLQSRQSPKQIVQVFTSLHSKSRRVASRPRLKSHLAQGSRSQQRVTAIHGDDLLWYLAQGSRSQQNSDRDPWWWFCWANSWNCQVLTNKLIQVLENSIDQIENSFWLQSKVIVVKENCFCSSPWLKSKLLVVKMRAPEALKGHSLSS